MLAVVQVNPSRSHERSEQQDVVLESHLKVPIGSPMRETFYFLVFIVENAALHIK
jgi:hypothetical protein